ncbi:MAG TPA: hypothetical protein VE503_14700 [Ornithinibacter sp.]|nr:hypothetical protein [Ornithinibacter sp.]
MVDGPGILVVGASGGLGASTLALAVGRRLAATGPAAVVDLDLDGGGLEVTAGVEHLPGRRWDDLREVRGRVRPDLLLASLPVDDGCHVLSVRGGGSPRPPERAALDVLRALEASGSRVVVDVPVGSASLPVLISRGPLVVVLVSLTTRGLADADAVVQRLHDDARDDDPGGDQTEDAGPRRPDLRLVTRGARGGAAVVDDLVAHLGVPHVCHLRHDAAVARDAERGLFPGTNRNALRRCADAVAAVVDDVATAS